MRIALVALSCQPGGMMHYTSQLANALAGAAEVHLFTPYQPELAAYLSNRVRLHPLAPLSVPHERAANIRRQLTPWLHLRHANAIREIRPDVVHLVTEHPCNPLLVTLLRGLKVCYTVHDPTGHVGEGSRVRRWLSHRTATLASAVVAHAAALREELVGLGCERARIAVIPHGDYGFLRNLAPEAPEEPMVLCFGRVIPYKGLDVLCKAERLLASRLANYEVCIAGEGDLACLGDHGGPNSHLTVINRFLSDSETSALFHRARVIVLPYIQASQSGVAAIALAFGKPLIVTDVGGLPEAVGFGQAGLVIPPNDPEALAGAIEQLWHDEALRRRLSAGARRLVQSESGWAPVAARHLQMYADLTSESRSSRALRIEEAS